MPQTIDEDGIFSSVQDFFVNYYYTILKYVLKDEGSSLMSDEDDQDINLGPNLYSNKDLRAVQMALMEEISSRFSRCK
jgi:hypothetical protein